MHDTVESVESVLHLTVKINSFIKSSEDDDLELLRKINLHIGELYLMELSPCTRAVVCDIALFVDKEINILKDYCD